MFTKFYYLAGLLLLLAGCVDDDNYRDTGISRSHAISIAEAHCREYPCRFYEVDRADFNPDGQFWLVALTDREGLHGRAFRISRAGYILDARIINRSDDNPGYGDSYGYTGYGGYGYGGYGYPYRHGGYY